ncbi:hypothetical protein [Lysobacter humi (ex Lee et al. 2017)]
MTTPEVHPLLRCKRPLIFTRPGERLAGATRATIEMGCDALWIEGNGRVGKTFGAQQLVQTDAWRPYPMYMMAFTYTKPTKPTEGYFMTSLLTQMGQNVAASASSNMLMTRVVRTLNEQRVKRGADMIGLVLNEANRFTSEEYEHAMSIGNELEKTTRVFYLFINQNDAGRLGRGDTDARPPRHIFGRYFINSHHYTGLLWDVPAEDRPHQTMSDVALAFLEYDKELTWPEGSGISFTQHCAPKAWANGWRLGSQIDMIRKVMNEVRAEAGLGAATTWPMLTFEKFVYMVLVRIAMEDEDFLALTEAQVREALFRVGYLEIEPGYEGMPA